MELPADRDFVEGLARRRGELRRAERRVLDQVVARPAEATRMSVSALAKKSEVSEPTVVRFCRALGWAGFRDFKLDLARSLAGGLPYVHRALVPGDDPATVVDKIFTSSLVALAGVRRDLPPRDVERAVSALAAARRVDCFGVGSASFAALDAQQKFIGMGIATTAYHDTHLQIGSAATLGSGDCALCFSVSGNIKDIVQIAKSAVAGGATVVAVTRREGALARAATIVLPVDTHEDTEIYAPMTSRLAHLAIIDVLATLVALRRGPATIETLRRFKDGLRPQRVER